jgi:hypothetical protein
MKTRDLRDLTVALTGGLPLVEAKALVAGLQGLPRSESKALRNLVIQIVSDVPLEHSAITGMVGRFERWLRPDRVPIPHPPFDNFPRTRGPWEPV